MSPRSQVQFVGKQKTVIDPRRDNCPYNLLNTKSKYRRTSTNSIEVYVIQEQQLQEEGTGKYLTLC